MERLPAVRCYSCGKVLPSARYERLLREENKTPEQAFSALGLKRYCCRTIIENVPVVAARQSYVNTEPLKSAAYPPFSMINKKSTGL